MSRNLHKAALEYMNGCKARAEEQELSVRGLARKFKCCLLYTSPSPRD